MPRQKSKPRSFFEPWHVKKSVKHGPCPFGGKPPEGYDPETARNIIEAWQRVDENADFVIWGSGMAIPSIAVDWMTGKSNVADDKRIIAVNRYSGLREGSPTHEDVARRIAACVNACAYVADPECFIADVRKLLLDLAKGDYDPANDTRVVSLLARSIPPEEFEKHDLGVSAEE